MVAQTMLRTCEVEKKKLSALLANVYGVGNLIASRHLFSYKHSTFVNFFCAISYFSIRRATVNGYDFTLTSKGIRCYAKFQLYRAILEGP